jgi:hypothetical protein
MLEQPNLVPEIVRNQQSILVQTVFVRKDAANII